MPDLTTSRSISSTASPARAPPHLDADISGGARARARAPVLLRARGEGRDSLHARLGRGARAPGRCDGGVLRARRRAADRRRLPVVRDGELLPNRAGTGPPIAPQPRVLARDATTSVSASAPSRPSTARAGETGRDSRVTSPRLPRVSCRRASPRLLDEDVRVRERLMLGLRLDEPLQIADVAARDRRGRARSAHAARPPRRARGSTVQLTPRGRHLGGGVTAELLA